MTIHFIIGRSVHRVDVLRMGGQPPHFTGSKIDRKNVEVRRFPGIADVIGLPPVAAEPAKLSDFQTVAIEQQVVRMPRIHRHNPLVQPFLK
jgi:hypothetical protein